MSQVLKSKYFTVIQNSKALARRPCKSSKIQNSNRGVSLIIVFLVMTVMISIVLSIGTILFNEIKIIGTIGNSTSAFYSADTGIEKTSYLDRKKIPNGSTRGFCDICNSCNQNGIDPSTFCSNCTLTPIVNNGCDLEVCNNCYLVYDASVADKTYTVYASVTPDPLNASITIFKINSKGFFRQNIRQIEVSSTSQVIP